MQSTSQCACWAVQQAYHAQQGCCEADNPSGNQVMDADLDTTDLNMSNIA